MITQALQCSSRAAVVSYSYITDRVEMLAKFLRLDIRTFFLLRRRNRSKIRLNSVPGPDMI